MKNWLNVVCGMPYGFISQVLGAPEVVNKKKKLFRHVTVSSHWVSGHIHSGGYIVSIFAKRLGFIG